MTDDGRRDVVDPPEVPQTMRVARLHAWGDVRVEREPVPGAGPGEIVVRIEACGLCGSDALEWYVARKAPVVLGHEPVGTIVEVGTGVDHLRIGDRVFVHHHAPCMQCAECKRRLWSNCATWRRTQLDPGGFAEYARVGADSVARDVIRLPAPMSDVTATFIEPTACCLRALAKARTGAADAVLIVGLGAMGLLLARLARVLGSRSIVGIDLLQSRRALAVAAGVQALDAAGDWLPELREHMDGRGADVVIVTPGTRAAVRAGLAGAAPGARVVCFTPLNPAERIDLDLPSLYFREIELLQSYSCGPDETRRAFELLESGTLVVDDLVTHSAGLDGVATALDRMHAADGLKTVILPRA
jgi:L-iditol 2-dehydrogenase